MQKGKKKAAALTTFCCILAPHCMVEVDLMSRAWPASHTTLNIAIKMGKGNIH